MAVISPLAKREVLDAVVETKDDILPKLVANDRTFARPSLLYGTYSGHCNRFTVVPPLATTGRCVDLPRKAYR